MIRISRGLEPQVLRSERRQRLSRAILDQKSGDPIDFAGYEVAKEALVKAFNLKCAFCEKDLRMEGNPVEHFRPKSCVINKGAPKDPSRYWWLAWTWENLLFACFRCNTSYKQNQFPLEPGTSPLAELSFDLGEERPLLIDPARVDARDHFQFRWSDSRGRWIPVPVPGSKEGQATIGILGLDDDEHPTEHVRERVEHWMERLEDDLGKDDPQAVQATWKRMIRSLFAPRQPFHAVTWDALNARFPEEVRRKWGLELPLLGNHEDFPPSPVFDKEPAEFSHLPEELQLRVRALGIHAPWEELRKVLREVLLLQQWTDEELSRLFGRTPATIKAYRQKLP